MEELKPSLKPTPSSAFSEFPKTINFLSYLRRFKIGFLLLSANAKFFTYITEEKAVVTLSNFSKNMFPMEWIGNNLLGKILVDLELDYAQNSFLD